MHACIHMCVHAASMHAYICFYIHICIQYVNAYICFYINMCIYIYMKEFSFPAPCSRLEYLRFWVQDVVFCSVAAPAHMCCTVLRFVWDSEFGVWGLGNKAHTENLHSCCFYMRIENNSIYALQHAATAAHCNTLQYAAADTATRCNALQHTATHCNTLQHTATHCNTLQHTGVAVQCAHRKRGHLHPATTHARWRC